MRQRETIFGRMSPKLKQPSRRDLFKSGALLGGLPRFAVADVAAGAARPPVTVRDRFWLWGHAAGSHNG